MIYVQIHTYCNIDPPSLRDILLFILSAEDLLTSQKAKLYWLHKGIIFVCVYDCSIYFFIVDSNDSLYGGDPKFVKQVAVLVHTLISQVLDHLKSLAQPEEVQLFTHIAQHGNLNVDQVAYNSNVLVLTVFVTTSLFKTFPVVLIRPIYGC